MSERGYFSLRYAIPGYSLILLVVGVNYVPLLRILEITKLQSAFGAFLAFLSLFAGSALGFLVSQFYWWWFQRKCGILGLEEFRKPLKTLVKKYGFKEPPWNENTKRKVLALCDIISHSVEKKEEKLFELETRRWDMYHLLSSTLYTLPIGLVVGIISRIYYEYFLFAPSFSIPFLDLVSIPFLENAELIALLSLFLSVVFLLLILSRSKKWIATKYATIWEARIRGSNIETEDLRELFPDVFPDS